MSNLIEITVNGEPMLVDPSYPLSVAELVYLTGRSESYIYALKRAGLPLLRHPGSRCQAISWDAYRSFIADNPGFRFDQVYRPKVKAERDASKNDK